MNFYKVNDELSDYTSKAREFLEQAKYEKEETIQFLSITLPQLLQNLSQNRYEIIVTWIISTISRLSSETKKY